ncbi:HlyC/CorC family transporter [Allohahella sp. A8]|uniref:HlyC/CorC family transporter n=1 Tax=Allohahella sp. A8 TaxID=3141461 RepID=UPI000C0B717D|nr:magnesium/cobalt efflux protein [Hahellaceae bacterium]|tara:strand:- start:2775 stop:3641 length:867 start_codon:yes stop_codon:yes gene_type:complete
MTDPEPEQSKSHMDSPARSWISKLSAAFSAEPQDKSELLEILRAAESRQIIDTESLGLIEGAMQVTDMQVREVMVPRAQMIVIKASASPEDYLEEILDAAHSRYPVIGESRDDVVGILLAKDLLPLALKGELTRAQVINQLRPVSFVPESKRLNQLLKDFKTNRNHMAIVVDEYGGVAGLVTIEDVLEQIVGDIEDEHDFDEEGFIKRRDDSQFVVKALTPIEDFNEYFGLELDEDEYDTIGGLVVHRFGRLPKRGESIAFGDFMVKILNSDNRQIRLMQFTRQAEMS